MATASEMLNRPEPQRLFENLYGSEDRILTGQYKRYEKLIHTFQERFGSADIQLFSTPGRTEIGGNHTDHNHGRVLAGSVNLDSIAIAAATDDPKIVVYSDGYPAAFVVDLNALEIEQSETGTTTALIRGIAARFKELGFQIGGFNASIQSDVLPGSGLSSSASIEVLIGSILNSLYNQGKIAPETIAIVGQYAENVYFGKPSGLMDQMTCAIGGIITIDFNDPQKPITRKIDFDFQAQNYNLLVVDTGGNHADLTDDYAAVPHEMKSVAGALGQTVCRELSFADVLPQLQKLRSAVGDRAILRAYHFFHDNERVVAQVRALENKDFVTFLALVNESGNSSFKWLQNCYTTKNPGEQGISLALALSEDYVRKIGQGACRVHGGGFAGTIQAFLPHEFVPQYIELMDSVFGKNSVQVLNIRAVGTIHLNAI